MLLDVAVEERQAGLVGGEVYYGAAVIGDDHRVLYDAGGLLAVDFDQLPPVAVEMQGVGVVGAVAEGEPVARALLQDEFVVRGDMAFR